MNGTVPMEILSVTLKNFKSHSDRRFHFQPGTNAICGENGAGKTSILEAIAWTLFNYRGAYRHEDLIRNGSASAQAMVAFISSRDGRTYEVHRCTSKGYTIYDPQLDQRLEYRHIEEEVIPWLRQHLGVLPGTDLAKLFANTIGVPQGTFTVDFLQAAENRKKVFDAILKVEEYKQVYTELGSLEKYAKAEVESRERAIAQYEELLQEWDGLREQRRLLYEEITTDTAVLQTLQHNLTTLQAERDRLSAYRVQVQQLEVRLNQLQVQLESKCHANQILEQTLQRAQQSAQLCQANRLGYEAFLHTEAELKKLDQQSKQRQVILKQRDTHYKNLASRQTELTKLTVQLEQLTKAQVELDRLQPLIQEQINLEQEQTIADEQVRRFQTIRLEQQALTKQLTKLQLDLTKWDQEINRLQSYRSVIEQIPELEQQRDRLQAQLSRVETAKQFEAELQQLVKQGEAQCDRHQIQVQQALTILHHMQQTVPLLATASVDSALAVFQSGVDLTTELLNRLRDILADLTEQTSIAKLKQQSYQLKLQLETAYRQQAECSTLATKLEQYSELQDEIVQLQAQLAEGQRSLAAEADWQQQRSHLTAQLRQLDDPRGHSQRLQRDLQQQLHLQSAYANLHAIQAGIQEQITTLDDQLTQFEELDAKREQQQQLRQSYQAGYLTFLQHQQDAEGLPKLQADLQTAIAHYQHLQAEQQRSQEEYHHLVQTYDPDYGNQVESQYHDTQSQADRIAGSLPQQHKRLQELDNRLVTLQDIAEKRDRTHAELKQGERAKRFISFARKAYKEAGPRITERYVQTISREADKLFRELMNRPNVALEWTRDYEIVVQEGSHSRRFINLSGGEQMCAALAVRLALLRILADIDIAFFDEPTTNMDRPRRESLAEAIANIKTFRQLFVISHDDTFEKVTENIILVQRE